MVVLRDHDLSRRVTEALEKSEIDVAEFFSAMVAWEALKTPEQLEVLVVNTAFGIGMPTGIALVRHARYQKGKVHAVLVGHDAASDWWARDDLVLLTTATAEQIVETVVGLAQKQLDSGTLLRAAELPFFADYDGPRSVNRIHDG
jgi:hypothetical protein